MFYPIWKYHATCAPQLLETQEALDALSPEWCDTPEHAMDYARRPPQEEVPATKIEDPKVEVPATPDTEPQGEMPVVPKIGPTIEEYVAAGYAASSYPPSGYEAVPSDGLTAYRAAHQ